MYNFELGVFMYKYYINDLPRAFKHYFTKRSDIHNHPTRQMKDFNLTLNKKSFSDHSIRTAGPFLWNSLPEKGKDSKSIKHFQNQLKKKFIPSYVDINVCNVVYFGGRLITGLIDFPAYSSVCFVFLFNFRCTVFMEINK